MEDGEVVFSEALVEKKKKEEGEIQENKAEDEDGEI